MRDKNRPRGLAAGLRQTPVFALGLTAFVAIIASIVSVALAAGPPAATTSAASNVTNTSATLNATVFPNQNATTYYFQYGTTASYGAATPTQGPVSGNAGKSVSADLTGLTPGTTYHFRIVATNSAGPSNGADTTFTTTSGPSPPAPANAVTIASKPTTVTFGGSTLVSGQVTGPGAAGVTVTLEQNPFPYTGGFKSTALTTTTTATGAYSLAVAPTGNTHYRITAKTTPPVTSSEIAVGVTVKVGLKLSTRTPRIGQRVRFSGTVTPAHNGKRAQIQRRTAAGTWKTVAAATLVAASPVNGIAVSKFSKRLRISRTATYRVQVNPADGDHLTGTSSSRRIRAR
jgi:hypothetical protein